MTPARMAVKETGVSPEATEVVYLIIKISLTNIDHFLRPSSNFKLNTSLGQPK